MRCYGYTPEGDVIPAEADVIRAAVHDVLVRRIPILQVMNDLNTRGVPTATGGQWKPTSLRRLLTNPRLAGIGRKSRQDNSPPPAIIATDQHRRLAAQATERSALATANHRPHIRATRLLSDLVVCAKDAKRMSGANGAFGPNYRCETGHAQVQAALLDDYITGMALAALRQGHRPVPPETPSTLAGELAELDRRRVSIKADRAAGLISDTDAQRLMGRRERRLAWVKARLDEIQATTPWDVHIPEAGDLDTWWASATQETRRAVIVGLFSEIRIGEPRFTGRAGGLETSRVQIKARPGSVPAPARAS